MKNLFTTLLLSTTYALAPLKASTLSVNADGDPYTPVDMSFTLEDIPVQCNLTARNDDYGSTLMYANFTFTYWLDIDVTMHYSSNYQAISISRILCHLGEVVTTVYVGYSSMPIYEYVLLGNDLTFEKEITFSNINYVDLNDVGFGFGICTNQTQITDKTYFALTLERYGEDSILIDNAVFTQGRFSNILGNDDDLSESHYAASSINNGVDISFSDYRQNVNFLLHPSIPRPQLYFTGKNVLMLYPILEPLRRAYVLLGDSLAQKYLEGRTDGYNAGKAEWYPKGVQDGSSNMGVFTMIGNAFTGLTNIFSVELGGGFTIGLLLCIPLAVTIIIVIVKLLGGGS